MKVSLSSRLTNVIQLHLRYLPLFNQLMWQYSTSGNGFILRVGKNFVFSQFSNCCLCWNALVQCWLVLIPDQEQTFLKRYIELAQKQAYEMSLAQPMNSLPQARLDGYLARFCQNLLRKGAFKYCNLRTFFVEISRSSFLWFIVYYVHMRAIL